ncbi:MAG: OmpA family protein, partial [Saprospiraceae bacterium]
TFIVDSLDRHLELKPLEYLNLLGQAYTQINGSPVGDPIRSAFNQDIWIAEGDSLGFHTIVHPGAPLNNALPNSVATITPDPNALYVFNQYAPNGDMDRGFSVVRRTSDSLGWTFPKPITIKDYYTISSDVNLTMSYDGKVLILSAVRGDSRNMDLYVCFKEGPDQWGAPQSLGEVVNSAQRETTPFLSEDNYTLYFSSDRPGSSGGNDIFSAKRLDKTWKNWSVPTRMDDPVNSRGDDSQPYFNTATGFLYFTSNRESNNSDIYRVRIAPPQQSEFPVKIRVINRKTNQLVTGATVFYDSEDGSVNQSAAPDGTLSLSIPKGVHFNFTPVKTGLRGTTDSVVFRRDYYYFRERYLDLYMDPLQVADKIELLPIYFQQSKALILESSFTELDKLYSLLAENPGLHIRVEGHTDNIGKSADLLQLSQERALAIKTFLLAKGISSDRIETVGYGAQKPLTNNASDELRQKNRRVEIVITKV